MRNEGIVTQPISSFFAFGRSDRVDIRLWEMFFVTPRVKKVKILICNVSETESGRRN